MKKLLSIIVIMCIIFTINIDSAPRSTSTTEIVYSDGNFGELNIIGTLTASNVDINGDLNFENISVTNNADINHLSVYGDATLCDNVTICNNLEVGGTLTANLTFTDLSVTGDATVDGNLTVNGTLSLPGSFLPNNIDLVNSTTTMGKFTKSGANFIINPGGSNTFVGLNAGTFALTTGFNNSGFGINSLNTLTTTAQNNTAIGPNTLANITTGSYNTAAGLNAGINYASTESSNIIISNNGTTGDNNTIRIGTDGTGIGQQNQCFIAGIYGKIVGASNTIIINSAGQMGTIVSSRRFKQNITPISDEIAEKFFQAEAVQFQYANDPQKTIQFGFVAEDIEKLIPELIIYDKENTPFTIQYHLLYALLHKMNTIMKKRIDIMEERILTLEHQLKQINFD